MEMKKVLISLIFCCIAPTANAVDDKFYVGLNVGSSSGDVGENTSEGITYLNFGYNFNKVFSVELRTGTSLGLGDAALEIDSFNSLNAKAHKFYNNYFSPYFTVGYSRNKLKGYIPFSRDEQFPTATEYGVVYGIGNTFISSPNTRITFEFTRTRMNDDENTTADSFAVGFNYKF